MLRILHVRPVDADFQTERCIEHLTGALGEDFSAEIRDIPSRGLGSVIRGSDKIRFWQRRGEFDIIHTWSLKSALAAAWAGCGRIIYSPPTEETVSCAGWISAADHYRAIETVCSTATQRKTLVEGGVPLDRCHLIRPGVDFSRLRAARQENLRSKLALPEGDFVVLAPGESTIAADHRQAIWALSLLNAMDSRFRLLLWQRGPVAKSTVRFVRRLYGGQMLLDVESAFGRACNCEELATIADAAILTGDNSVAPLPVCVCMAAGLPAVSTVTYTYSEMLEDNHTALMVGRATPAKLANRMLDLERDRALRSRLGNAARTEAYEFFSLSQFLSHWRTAYRGLMKDGRIDLNNGQAARAYAAATRIQFRT